MRRRKILPILLILSVRFLIFDFLIHDRERNRISYLIHLISNSFLRILFRESETVTGCRTPSIVVLMTSKQKNSIDMSMHICFIPLSSISSAANQMHMPDKLYSQNRCNRCQKNRRSNGSFYAPRLSD